MVYLRNVENQFLQLLAYFSVSKFATTLVPAVKIEATGHQKLAFLVIFLDQMDTFGTTLTMEITHFLL